MHAYSYTHTALKIENCGHVSIFVARLHKLPTKHSYCLGQIIIYLPNVIKRDGEPMGRGDYADGDSARVSPYMLVHALMDAGR